ncbi:MAG: GFA family protein [Gammaproteobacteria bacterium]|jgi:hypothetical protein|nr:GFA family protein [Gammaproteobacteria bacterium]
MSDTHKGSCFCGTVQFEVSGAPVAMGICHCDSCRHWSAGPVNSFALWPKDVVKITAGADAIGTYAKTDNSHRKWCTKCGGHVMNDHPGMAMADVFAAVLPTLEFKPAIHVFYGEKMIAIKDGLPKFKDLPAEFGGSGDTLPE